MSKQHKDKDSQAPQFLPPTEDLANLLGEWSEAFEAYDLQTATRIYEQQFFQYSRSATEEWRRSYFASHPQQKFAHNKMKLSTPNPFPPQKSCKSYLPHPTAEALYIIPHVREGANRVGNASYRKAIWEAFTQAGNMLSSSDVVDVPACIAFDLVDEMCYQVWQHSTHTIRQRNKFLIDLATLKMEASRSGSDENKEASTEGAASNATSAPLSKAETATTGAEAAALAQAHNVKLPEFDSIPDVWQYAELYKKFSEWVKKTKIEELLANIASGKVKPFDLFESTQQQATKAGKDKKTISARVNAVFGFMAMFGLIRLSVAAGDYLGALEVANKLAWDKISPVLAATVSRAHTAIVHNVGAALMMTRRFSDAVSILLQGLTYPSTPFRKYHEQAQVAVWGLTQMCSVLADVPIPDYTDRFQGFANKAAQAKGQTTQVEDPTIPMFQGDMQTFKDTFVQSMPKYILVGYDLRTPVSELKNLFEINPHDVLEVQLRMFLREVQQNLAGLQTRGAMKVYSAFPVEKINQLSQSGRDAAANAATLLWSQLASSTPAASVSNMASTVESEAGSAASSSSTALTKADAIAQLVNLKTKSLQTCEYNTASLNPALEAVSDSKNSSNNNKKLKCVSSVDFSCTDKQVTILRYKEVTTLAVKLTDRILAVFEGSHQKTKKQ